MFRIGAVLGELSGRVRVGIAVLVAVAVACAAYSHYFRRSAACEGERSTAISAEACYAELAQWTGDDGLCDSATEKKDEAGDSEREGCLRQVAIALEEPKLCGRIKHRDAAALCYESVAVSLRKPEICALIFDLSSQANCLARSMPPGEDPKFCESQTDPTLRKRCLLELSINRPELCARLSSEGRFACMKTHIEELDDPVTICGGAVECLVAVSEFDVAACAQIPEAETDARSRCLEHALAKDVITKEWTPDTFCERLHGSLRDRCFARIAAGNFHESACSKIEDSAAAATCVEGASRARAVLLKRGL